jgi:hypothetical protein
VLALLQELARAVLIPPETSEEVSRRESVRAAFGEAREQLRRLLNDDDDVVLANVAHLLSILGMAPEELQLVLERLPTCRRSAAVAGLLISVSAASEPDRVAVVMPQYLESAQPEVRVAAAIALATRSKMLSPHGTGQVLVTLGEGTCLDALGSEFQWWDGHIAAMAAHALGTTDLGERSTRRAILLAAIDRRLDAGQSFGTTMLPGRWMEDPERQIEMTELAEQLFSVTTSEFRGRSLDEVLAAEIGEDDRDVLLRLNECGAMAMLEQRRRSTIVDRGLWLCGVVRRFFGCEPRGPLDGPMGPGGVEPAWKRFRRWDRGELINLERELIASFTPSEIVSLAEDVFTGAYRPVRGLTLVDERGPGVLVSVVDRGDPAARSAAASLSTSILRRCRTVRGPSSSEACYALMSAHHFGFDGWAREDDALLLSRVRLTPHIARHFEAWSAGRA